MACAPRAGVKRLAWPREGNIFTEGGATIGYLGAGYRESVLNMIK